jgi:hypothetical protein
VLLLLKLLHLNLRLPQLVLHVPLAIVLHCRLSDGRSNGPR